MATYEESGDSMLTHQASEEDIHNMMLKKAHELFAVCDKENKGFITKRDMQRLQDELPLSPQQLEDVFDSLDEDGNGYLTLEEFTEGFGGFIGLGPSGLEKQTSIESTGSNHGNTQEHVYENEQLSESENEEQHFQDMIETIGVHTVIDDADTLRALWSRLRTDDSQLLGQFEKFLGRVTTELQRTHQEHQTLESVLRNKSSAHDDEVRKLYEEMENQIKLEKDRVMAEEKAKERQLREELEQNIVEKDRQLQDILQNHIDVQQKLSELNSTEAETKLENERLEKEKRDMEDMLIQSQRNLDDSKAYITQLRQQYRTEKKERALAALQISEGIALERESLVKQLEMLREMNKKLRDDRDEAELRRGDSSSTVAYVRPEHGISTDKNDNNVEATKGSSEVSQGSQVTKGSLDQPDGATATDDPWSQSKSSRQNSYARPSRGPSLEKQGSILSNYFGPTMGRTPSTIESDDDIECDDVILPSTNQGSLESANPTAFNLSPELFIAAQQEEENISLAQEMFVSEIEMSYLQREMLGTSDPQLMANRNAELLALAAKANMSQQEYLEAVERGEFPPLSWNPPPTSSVRGARSVQGSSLHEPTSLTTSSSTGDKRSQFSSKSPTTGRVQGSGSVEFDLATPRGVPVGANSSTDPQEHDLTPQEIEQASPERLFKVVFVGDSGVGKSSFIHQFCNHTFKATFSATIGVDFQVKNVQVDNKIIALQLWDTAGQERFRSITKQYFRKADGVVIMYDVTSEVSFKNVRNWMISVQEGTEDDTVLIVVGNKMDLVDEQQHRVVTTKDGTRLADEYGALFYETSAKSGLNVPETIQGLASLLREHEDRQLQKSLNLSDSLVEKKTCCR